MRDGLGPNQVKSRNTGTDEVQTRDIVGGDVFGSCGKCECAFHVAIAFGVFCSELHDKGQAASYRGIGQQTVLGRPADFSRF